MPLSYGPIWPLRVPMKDARIDHEMCALIIGDLKIDLTMVEAIARADSDMMWRFVRTSHDRIGIEPVTGEMMAAQLTIARIMNEPRPKRERKKKPPVM